jgi:hypothetical protein
MLICAPTIYSHYLSIRRSSQQRLRLMLADEIDEYFFFFEKRQGYFSQKRDFGVRRAFRGWQQCLELTDRPFDDDALGQDGEPSL